MWTEVRTDHFTIVGNARVRELREIAGDLERIRSIFAMGFGGAHDPPVPVVVFAVRNEADLRVLAPSLWMSGKGPAGFFQDVRTRVQIGIRLDVANPSATAFHEYHHLLANVATPNLPMWLSEGLASLWGEAIVDGRRVEVGRLDPAHVRSNRPPGSIAHLVRAKPTLTRAGGFRHHGEYYAHAKLFTHLLLYGRSNGEASFRSLLQKIGEGVPAERALVEHYGSLDELQREFDRYLKQDSFAFRRIEFAADPASSSTWVSRTLSEAAAVAHRGEFLRLGGGADDESAVFFRAALRLDPTEPRALANLALLSPLPEGKRLIAKIDARADAGYEAHWIAARILTTASAGNAIVGRHLETTIDLAPGFVPAWVQLAKLRANENTDLALELLDRAIEMDPSRPELLVRFARILGDEHPAEAGAIAKEGARRATAMPRTGVRVVCHESAALGFHAAALIACDAALEREPDDWRSRDSRAFARAASGDLAGAREDFRGATRGAMQSGTYAAELLEYRESVIRALDAGQSPPIRKLEIVFPDEWD